MPASGSTRAPASRRPFSPVSSRSRPTGSRPSAPRTPTSLDAWRSRRRLRIIAAALLLVLAATLFAKDKISEVTAFVAATDLPKGHVLAREDLRRISAPDSLTPAASVASLADASGRELVSAISEGEILTNSRLDATAGETPADVRIVSVPIPDRGTLALLHPGSIVDIFSAPTNEEIGGSRALTSGAQVKEVPRDSRGEPAGTVAIQVPTADSAYVASAALDEPLIIVLVE